MRVQEGSSKIILILAVRFRACIKKDDLGSEEWMDGIGGSSVLRWVKRQTGKQWQVFNHTTLSPDKLGGGRRVCKLIVDGGSTWTYMTLSRRRRSLSAPSITRH